jgi:hypothetical protein
MEPEGLSRRPITMSPLRSVSVLAAVAALLPLSGCGQDSITTEPAQRPSPSGQPLLQVEKVGGLMPAQVAFAALPELTVHADGRAFVLGPQPAIFPGPALPNVRVRTLSDAQLAELVEQAGAAGLLSAPPDYGQPPIADAPATVLTLHVDGTTYEHSVEALGVDLGLPGAPDITESLDPRAQQARAQVTAFLERAQQIVEASGTDEAYVPDGFALQAQPAQPAQPAQQPVRPRIVPWPLPGVDLDAGEGCQVVEGDAADTLLSTLREANALTRFTQDGAAYEVAVRPLLPGDDGC